MQEREPGNNQAAATGGQTVIVKRGYRSPVLTEYGSVEDLVDAGVVGSEPITLPSTVP